MSAIERHHLEVFIRKDDSGPSDVGYLTIRLPSGVIRKRPFRLVLDGNDLVTQEVEIEDVSFSGRPIYIATIKLIVGDLQVTEVEDPSKLELQGGTLVAPADGAGGRVR